MARAWVSGPLERVPAGDNIAVTYSVVFYGTDVPAPDFDKIEITVLPTDGVTAVEDKIVTAAVDKGTSLGYAMARTRVGYPKTARGA